MNISTLIGMSADELEKMSDQQLFDWFSPMFKVTRPEQVERRGPVAPSGGGITQSVAFKAKVNQLAELGIDVGYLRGVKIKR